MVIYKITNKLNGKIYVGQTRQSIEKRFLQHSASDSPLGQAMRDCGIDNFTIEVIEECDTKEQADEQERFWIKVLKCKVPDGYNQTDGGAGAAGYVSVRRQREKISCPLKVANPIIELPKTKMTVAEALKRFRKTFRLTQKDVAARLGVSQQSYQVYEGKTVPSATVLIKLADAYDVTTDYLLGRSDSPRPATIDKEWISRLTASRDLIQSILRDTGQVPAQ